jgi:hypothetical protein
VQRAQNLTGRPNTHVALNTVKAEAFVARELIGLF